MTDIQQHRFLPHVHGARALAILGVVLYHLDASFCSSGYFGVDLFLVISGYFLLQGLLKPGAAENFHYGRFLARKAWRILPSWAVVSVAVCAAAYFLMLGGECQAAGVTVRFSSVLVVDYFLDYYYNYFNPNSQLNPLLHFWYLNITEQLYLATPLLVIPLARWCSRRAALALLYAAGGLSLAFYILTTASFIRPEFREQMLGLIFAKGAYYHLIPRFWEVVAGFVALSLPLFKHRGILRSALAFLGLVAVVASFFAFEKESSASYCTVIGAMLLLRYGDAAATARLLSWKPLQAIGTISFSLYLWHWPVMVMWKYFRFTPLALPDYAGMLALSLLLAWFSWRWVESVKMPSGASVRSVCLRWGLLLCMPILYGASLLYAAHLSRLHEPDPPPHAAIAEQGLYRDDALMAGFDSALFPNKPIYYGDNTSLAPTFVVVGDSHAQQLYHEINRYCTQHSLRGIYMNNAAPPIPGVSDAYLGYEQGWRDKDTEAFFRYLEAQPSVRYVVVILWWDWRVINNFMDKGLAEEHQEALFLNALREGATRLRQMGKQMILVADSPFVPDPGPRTEWRRKQKVKIGDMPERLLPVSEHLHRQKWVPHMMQTLKDEGSILGVIDLGGPLRRGDHYITRLNGEFLFWDNNHMTLYGLSIVTPMIMAELEQLMRGGSAAQPTPEPSSLEN